MLSYILHYTIRARFLLHTQSSSWSTRTTHLALVLLHEPLQVKKLDMSATASLTVNQETLYNHIRSKNPSAFVKVVEEKKGGCCLIL